MTTLAVLRRVAPDLARIVLPPAHRTCSQVMRSFDPPFHRVPKVAHFTFTNDLIERRAHRRMLAACARWEER